MSYSLNSNLVESYVRTFNVAPGADYFEDFSTPTRQKTFSVSAAKVAGDLVVTTDYFNDVGVFHAISSGAQMTLQKGRNTESTSGTQGFYTNIGAAGNHVTTYKLSCQRV